MDTCATLVFVGGEGFVTTTAQLAEELRQMSNTERLEVIEVATRLVRDNLTSGMPEPRTERDRRMRAAAGSVKDLYEGGSDMTEWTALDAEEFADDYLER